MFGGFEKTFLDNIIDVKHMLLLGTQNWNDEEKKFFYWIIWKEQKIGEKTLLQAFSLQKGFLPSQKANAQSTNDKIPLSPILLPLFISNKPLN